MLQKYEGIIIRTTDYAESDKIVTIFSREAGKIGGMARGAKKPSSRLAGISQLFTHGQFLLQTGRGLASLQQGEVIDPLRGLREDIFKTAYASYAAELLDKGTGDREPNPFLFELLYQTLLHISEGFDPDIILNIFEMKMLNVLGLYPVMNECAVCGNTESRFGFSIRENGLICERCMEKDSYYLPLSQKSVRLLRLFYYYDLQQLGNISVSEETKQELRRAISLYYEEYSGLYLKSKKFLDSLGDLKGRL